MQTILIVIHLLIVIALIITVLLQRSEGGALGMGGSATGGNLFSGRGQANALTRATAILGTLFFITSISLTILAGWSRAPKSIFEGAAPAAPAGQTLPADTGQGNLFDQLKKMQQEKAPAGNPASTSRPVVPVAPVPTPPAGITPPVTAPAPPAPPKEPPQQ